MPAPSPILGTHALGFRWGAVDPFLYCVYHDNRYPRANSALGPDAPLSGRDLGQDFSGKDGWSMYHGTAVPGFPAHPHRGFETVTIVREGLIDHSDSLGASARFGHGDVQWLTAGRGVVHAEMFPLLSRDHGNRLELFQIWLNLPASHKMAEPHFRMLWSEQIPRHTFRDADGATTHVTCIAGKLRGREHQPPPAPPPDSWASQAQSDLAIWTIAMAPGARWTLPAAAGRDTRRCLYFFDGAGLSIDGQPMTQRAAIQLRCDRDLDLHNGPMSAQLVMLQGKPIGEPVAQYGPFVMNTQAEIHQAFADYQRTRFGGWPWTDDAPVHGRDPQRFATHADGRTERPLLQPVTTEGTPR